MATQTYAKKLERNGIRQELRSAHLKSPILALSEALRKVEELEGGVPSATGGSRR